MSVLTNYPCMTQEDFESYRDGIENVLHNQGITNISHIPISVDWSWPAIVITNSVWSWMASGKSRRVDCYHSQIKASTIMKVLGLSKEEIKIEFDMKSELPIISESLEAREV